MILQAKTKTVKSFRREWSSQEEPPLLFLLSVITVMTNPKTQNNSEELLNETKRDLGWARALSLCLSPEALASYWSSNTSCGRMNRQEPRGGRGRFNLLVIHRLSPSLPRHPCFSPFTSTSKYLCSTINLSHCSFWIPSISRLKVTVFSPSEKLFPFVDSSGVV